MSGGIRLLSFDLDDTLWPCMPTINAAEKTLYSYLKNKFPAVTNKYSASDLHMMRLDLLSNRPDLSHNLSILRTVLLKELATEFELSSNWAEETFQIYYNARQRVTLFDDVSNVLDELQPEYRLAAVTNGNANIEKAGVGHWFEFAISAENVGFMKPHPAVFEALMEQSGCQANEIVHIGDDAHHDVFGASQAGICSIWINRNETQWQHTDCKADYQIASLTELPSLLADLKAK